MTNSEFDLAPDRLRVTPKLLSRWWAKYLIQIRLVLLLVLTIITLGVGGFLLLPRRLNPEIKLTIVSVATVLPGAGPQDIETLVTKPLEDKLMNVKGIDTITSTSRDSVSVIVMQFLSSVDKDKARTDVQTAVSEVNNLPDDAQTPKVTTFDFEDSPIWTFALTSPSDLASLMRFSQDLQHRLDQIPNVDRVSLSGFDTQEIQITLNPQKISQLGLNPLSLSNAIKNATKAFPSGLVYTQNSSFSLAIDTQVSSVDELRQTRLVVNGQPLRLGDVATIAYRSKPLQASNFLARPHQSPQNAVTFSVFKTSNADIDKTVKQVEKEVDTVLKSSPAQFQITTIANTGEEIGKQFTDLLGEFRSTIILVFINLLLFLGLRQALIACITIPLTFLLSFFWMNVFGQTINFISLFALLLAFGTSIDDTIVTVSAMTTYYRQGKLTPHQAAVLVWRDFVVPIWTTTITTVWAFLPLILSSGIIGEFIKPIPLVVATTMYTSTFIAWFVTLPLMIVLLKPQLPRRVKVIFLIFGFFAPLVIIFINLPLKWLIIPVSVVYFLLAFVAFHARLALVNWLNNILNRPLLKSAYSVSSGLISRGLVRTDNFSQLYQRLIRRILSSARGRRIAFICLLAFAFSSYLLIPIGLVKNEFFPKTNSEAIYINLDLPSGTNITSTQSQALQLTEELSRVPHIKAILVRIGSQMGGNGNFSDNPSSAAFTVLLPPPESRRLTSSDIASQIRSKYQNYQAGKLSVIEESGGPPAGADVQIKLLGDDLNTLNQQADLVIKFLQSQKGIVNVEKSIKEGTSKIVFTPNREKMAAAGLGPESLGFWLRTSASGFNLATVRFNSRDDQDIVFYSYPQQLSPDDISGIMIPTNTGFVPLANFGTLTLRDNPTSINHEAGKRIISVSAGVIPGYSISEVNQKLLQFVNHDLHLPSGYQWQTGGVNEENQKSVNSIFRAMGLSFILIMATMVIEFNSYRQAAIVLSLIPFAVSGVFIIFGLTGTPLSFPALIGVVALFGIVVTNAMFIVEKINQNRRHGLNLIDAIADAGQSRLEPIILTSLTSILGLVPITLANPLWRGLGGAIISGLMFSGIIMLIFVPLAYFTFFRSQDTK